MSSREDRQSMRRETHVAPSAPLLLPPESTELIGSYKRLTHRYGETQLNVETHFSHRS